MKKIISAALALIIAFTLSFYAFAEESTTQPPEEAKANNSISDLPDTLGGEASTNAPVQSSDTERFFDRIFNGAGTLFFSRQNQNSLWEDESETQNTEDDIANIYNDNSLGDTAPVTLAAVFAISASVLCLTVILRKKQRA